MAFVTEEDVRKETNLYDGVEIPSALILHGIAQAHQDILDETMLTEESTVSGEVKNAEVRLAVSYLFRQLALASTVTIRDWRASGLRVDETGRQRRLLDFSEELWIEAWSLLCSYLRVPLPSSMIVTKGGGA